MYRWFAALCFAVSDTETGEKYEKDYERKTDLLLYIL